MIDQELRLFMIDIQRYVLFFTDALEDLLQALRWNRDVEADRRVDRYQLLRQTIRIGCHALQLMILAGEIDTGQHRTGLPVTGRETRLGDDLF